MTRALFLSLLLAGCSSSKSPTAAPAPSPSPSPSEVVMNQQGPAPTATSCATEADVRAKLNTVCTVVGTYQLRDIPNKKGGKWRTWPVVQLDGDSFVALESVWDESKLPGDDEVARWRGKKVAVTGTVLPQPPSDSPANMSMLTIAPVESIELAP